MAKKMAALALSLMISLGALELGLRLALQAWPFAPEPYRQDHLSPSEGPLRWRYTAQDGRNRLGLRNREVGPKPVGTLRVLFLGDSLIYSGETTAGPLYTEVLEEQLQDSVPSGFDRVEVVNAGIPGYTTYQELEFLKRHGLQMEPDLVVLGFVFNDVFSPYLHRPTARRRLDYDPDSRLHQFDGSRFPGALFRWSHLAHQTVLRLRKAYRSLRDRPSFEFEWRGDFYLAWKPYGWGETERLFGELQDVLKAREIPLAVVVFPVSEQVDPERRSLDEAYVEYPQTRIAAICRERGIPMLDLTEAITQAGGAELYRDYLHLKPEGNDVVAATVEPRLRTWLAHVAGPAEHRLSSFDQARD